MAHNSNRADYMSVDASVGGSIGVAHAELSVHWDNSDYVDKGSGDDKSSGGGGGGGGGGTWSNAPSVADAVVSAAGGGY